MAKNNLKENWQKGIAKIGHNNKGLMKTFRELYPYRSMLGKWYIHGWCTECTNYFKIDFNKSNLHNPLCPKCKKEILDLSAPLGGVYRFIKSPKPMGYNAMDLRLQMQGEDTNIAIQLVKNVCIQSKKW